MARTKARTWRWLSPPERRAGALMLRDGATVGEVASRLGCSEKTVYRLRSEWALRLRRDQHSGLRLGFAERERISRGLAAGESPSRIARALGRPTSTVTRELQRNGGPGRYRALAAERRGAARARRPKPTKLSRCPALRRAVEAALLERWSPQQISARLKRDHPDDPQLRISHETIYQALYIQSRGELRRQLTENLRSQRKARRPRGSGPTRAHKIAEMVPISERPPEVEDRAVPGHWEGDLIVGKAGRSFVATLVERNTRYVMLARLGSDRSSARVVEALKERIAELPAHLVRSLTWDRGTELAAHERFSSDTAVDVYFCDPHSPWQRGSNENTNGLLRQYMPKGSDLSLLSQEDLDQIAAELNGRPRQTLDWLKPAEKMEELLR